MFSNLHNPISLPPVRIFPNSSRLLIYIFFGGILLLCLILLTIFLPSAKVILIIGSEPLIAELNLKLDQSIDEPLFNLKTLPAEWIDYHQAPLEINQEFEIINNLINDVKNEYLAFHREDLNRFIEHEVDKILGEEKKLYRTEHDIIKYKIKNFNISEGKAELNISLQTKVIPDYNLKSIKQDLANKRVEEATRGLRQLSNIRNVIIKCWPSFLERMPYLPQRINISLDII